MKTRILIKAMLVSLLISVVIYTQTIPQTINYQGLIKDAAGVVVPNGDYSLTFKLYDLPSGGSALWNETKTINVVDGIINTQLGSVTPITSATIVGAAWLGITVGTGSELIPRITLTSVPYSFITMNVVDGSITTIKLADNSINTAKIIDGTITTADIGINQVVKSINTLKDDVILAAGSNVTITPGGNTLTISSTGGGGGGTVIQVNTGSGLTGGPITTTGTISIANDGVTNPMLQNNSVTSNKIIDGTITTGDLSDNLITTSKIADNTITAVDLATGSVTSDEIADASVTTTDILNATITATDIANTQVVKSLNTLKDDVTLVAGSNITITPSGQNLTISTTGSSGIGGSGTTNYFPIFTNSTTLGNSSIYQNASGDIGLGLNNPTGRLEISGNSVDTYPHLLLSETDGYARVSFRTMTAPSKHWVLAGHTDLDDNSSQWHLNYFNGSVGKNIFSVYGNSNISFNGNVGIGTENPEYPLHVATNSINAGYFTTDALWTAHAVHGEYLGTGSYDGIGVYGKSLPADYYGFGGYFEGGYIGVSGNVGPTGNGYYYGVKGNVAGGAGINYGVYGKAEYGSESIGVFGTAYGGTTNWAGYFNGNVNVSGTLSKGGGSFKIDHPLDPTNKNLYHSFVESPDMMNIYNGNVVTDASGYATVTMPEWFEALNKEFRYQLTVIRDFAQAIVANEVQNNQFTIRTDKPNIKVSWQVTGIRHDKFAEKYRIPVEENKSGKDVGKYLHPDAFGIPESMGIDYETHKKALDKK